MLSVAQAVRHPETQGATSKHSIIGHPWSTERPNMLKRRKTDSDCYIDDKKLNDSTDILSQHLMFNSAEITLTPIPKSNSSIKELLQGKILTPPKKQSITDKQIQEEHNSNKILSKVPPQYRSILENNEEIQLTTLGSTDSIQFKNQKEIDSYHVECDDQINSSTIDTDIQQDKQGTTHSDTNFSQVTIECTSNKPENVPSSRSSSPKAKVSARTLAKLEKAQNFLKNQQQVSTKREVNLSIAQPIDTLGVKFNRIKSVSNINSTVDKYKRVNSPIHEELDGVSQEFADYEPFNIGVPCETFYPNTKDRPYYTTGFPNPAGENRCWTNATLQALFSLPILNKLDSLHFPECSKLISSLINVQKSWRKGTTSRHAFDNVFGTFKEELSVLDELYTSRAQQDVSEFVMNLLNFIESEFEAIIKKNLDENEIENVPNNEQESKSQLLDTNKRLPLSDISATVGQVKSKIVQKDVVEVKNEKCSNPIDDYFSSYMMEKYTCNSCSKQRQQKVENLMLFIDLPAEDHGNTVDLVDMINKTFAEEQRSMTCESCKHDVHTMESKFKKLPKILILQVKRYEMTSEGILTKKSTAVNVPKLLKLDSLVINNCQDIEHTPEFEPMCIISHIGDSINSGHYISFVKHENEWFYYDDINVTILSPEEVFKNIQNNAYLIFFQDTKVSLHVDSTDDKIEKDVC